MAQVLVMVTLLRREFTVDVPLGTAWQQLAQVEEWPSWAKHIKQVEVRPAGKLGPQSTGIIHLSNGFKSAFKMTEFNPRRNWKWVGRFFWLTIHYDHHFEELNPTQTKLTWVVGGAGFGVSVFGRFFAKIYNQNLDQAIPLLIDEMSRSALRSTT
jgi:hypothetical protein